MYSNQFSQNLRPVIKIWVFLTLTIALSVTLSPYNFSQASLGTFSWKAYQRDIIENLFLLFPLGFFLALFKDNMRFKDYVLYIFIGFLVSAFVESAQLFLKMRSSQYWDVICNTISLFLGLLVGRIITTLFTIKHVRLSASVALLSNIILLLFILFVVRTQLHDQSIETFEYLILFSIPLVISLIFSYPLFIHANAYYVKPFLTSLLCVSPLLLLSKEFSLTNAISTSLLLSLLTPFTLFLLRFLPWLKNKTKGRMLYLCITPPFLYFVYISSFQLDDYKLLASDSIINNKNGRVIGSIATEFLLLFTISSQLIIYKLLNRKSYVAFAILTFCVCIVLHYSLFVDTQQNQAFMAYIYISCIFIALSNYFLMPNKKYCDE